MYFIPRSTAWIISLNRSIKIVGTGVEDFSGGNHLCSKYYKLPYSYFENYIDEILKVVNKENIDLIIPSTDYEAYFLSRNKKLFKCEIAVSGASACEIYLDKYFTFQHHHACNIPFAKCFLPSVYNNEFKNCIAKPRKGRGSRGLILNPTEVTKLDDDEYLIQELFEGDEITTAFYVTKTKKILYRSFYRRKWKSRFQRSGTYIKGSFLHVYIYNYDNRKKHIFCGAINTIFYKQNS
jgi:carbamoyl-phosphate synthase large subunit